MTPKRVREAAPVQVYLIEDDRRRLERLGEQLDLNKSEILRRGLLALERELADPAAHPALRLIGVAAAELPDVPAIDAAREHDRALGEDEEAAWAPPKPSRRKRRGR
jgi:hypothetical protein